MDRPIIYCNCGLTGGCENCQPAYFPSIEYIFPETYEENFINPALKVFYEKKGYE